MSEVNQAVIRPSPFAALLILPARSALCASIGRRYFAGRQGNGIPQTIAAINVNEAGKNNTLLSLRIAFGKILLTVRGLATGASIGREGPTMQVGAFIRYAFYGRGSFQSVALRRKLILAGGAAGIAAAFNMPMAGIMFAMRN